MVNRIGSQELTVGIISITDELVKDKVSFPISAANELKSLPVSVMKGKAFFLLKQTA